MQKTGAAPTRSALVDQCRRDAAMLDTLCEAVSFSFYFILTVVYFRKVAKFCTKEESIDSRPRRSSKGPFYSFWKTHQFMHVLGMLS